MAYYCFTNISWYFSRLRTRPGPANGPAMPSLKAFESQRRHDLLYPRQIAGKSTISRWCRYYAWGSIPGTFLGIGSNMFKPCGLLVDQQESSKMGWSKSLFFHRSESLLSWWFSPLSVKPPAARWSQLSTRLCSEYALKNKASDLVSLECRSILRRTW